MSALNLLQLIACFGNYIQQAPLAKNEGFDK